LLALGPLLWLVTQLIVDPLFALVAFHSTINVLGILLFLPFVPRFARFLEARFGNRDVHVARFIHQVPPTVPDAAIEALQRETEHLFARVIALNRDTLGIRGTGHAGHPARQYRAIK